MPWFEEITAQRDTTGGVACSNLLCLPVRHILSLPSDAAQPTQVPRAKEDARELYAATVSVYPLYETTRQEGDGWPRSLFSAWRGEMRKRFLGGFWLTPGLSIKREVPR